LIISFWLLALPKWELGLLVGFLEALVVCTGEEWNLFEGNQAYTSKTQGNGRI